MLLMEALLLAGALLLAFTNGANDNFKGVATLYGSGALSYRRSLALGTVATALGGLTSLALAGALVTAFSGKGLVPDAALTQTLLTAVAVAAALTVLLATRLGIPVSTTHALVGGLAGAGWMAAGSDLNLAALGTSFALPLMAGPLLAICLTLGGLAAGRWSSRRLGVTSETCVCIGTEWVPVAATGNSSLTPALASAPQAAERTRIAVGERTECQQRYGGEVLGVSVQSAVTITHLASAGLVSFARGLNDAPKILGLLVGASVLSPASGLLAITAAMGLGGVLAARRVADTLAQKIAPMTPGQGLIANLTTAGLVIGATGLGFPVSTTHVSTGGIFGIGADSGGLRWSAAGGIVAAWLITLPMAAALSAGIFWGLR